jgi:RNA polymerase sigma-B factor
MSVLQKEQTEVNNQEIFKKYKQDRSIETRNEIVQKYLYVVDILIRKYLNKGVEYDDLYQVGSMALVFAVERFDLDRGYEFTSFATPTIIGEIKRYFRDKGWAMKVPRRLKELGAKIPLAKEDLERSLLRSPKVSEIAAYLGCSEEDVLEAMESNQAYGTYSLQQGFDENGENDDNSLDKYLGKDEEGYGKLENEELIRSVLDKLSMEEKQVFKMRFLDRTIQQEIAESLGVSQMTISRIEKKIREKFRKEFGIKA